MDKEKKPMRYKRMKLAIIFAIVNVALIILGIYKEVDLTALGTALSLINTPIYMFILGESYRPSDKNR